MSNIYIQEPPTNGKVLLKTSVGDIDVELWSKECPKACRNFVQLCLEGYYDNNIFHRLVKGFIVQTGDPTGTGMGGESIYGQPFKDEFHSRLRFVRRGLVAMANSGIKDDNCSQFFFTLGSCPELQNKHTIFGKVTGNTIYNMIRLEESDVNQNEKPLNPHKIYSTEILLNPFPDIIPRNTRQKEETKTQSKSISKGTKNFSLLSFGDEAEEEEEEVNNASKEFRGKSKSSHDLLKDDPKLSALPAVDTNDLLTSDEDIQQNNKEDNDDEEEEGLGSLSKRLNRIKRKFNYEMKSNNEEVLNKDEEEFLENHKIDPINKEKSCLDKVRDEFKQLKKQMCSELKKKYEKVTKSKVYDNPAVAEFIEEAKKYKEAATNLPKKGNSREQLCLSLLEKFKTRLLTTRQRKLSENEEENTEKREDDWLSHQMHCQKEEEKVLAKDANMRNEEDWYDIYDPRNPINKRRREEGLQKEPKKSRVK